MLWYAYNIIIVERKKKRSTICIAHSNEQISNEYSKHKETTGIIKKFYIDIIHPVQNNVLIFKDNGQTKWWFCLWTNL